MPRQRSGRRHIATFSGSKVSQPMKRAGNVSVRRTEFYAGVHVGGAPLPLGASRHLATSFAIVQLQQAPIWPRRRRTAMPLAGNHISIPRHMRRRRPAQTMDFGARRHRLSAWPLQRTGRTASARPCTLGYGRLPVVKGDKFQTKTLPAGDISFGVVSLRPPLILSQCNWSNVAQTVGSSTRRR